MALVSRLGEGLPGWTDPDAVVEAARQWLAGYFTPEQDHPGAAFVAEAEGEVVGVVSVNTRRHFTGPMEAYIGELAVARRFYAAAGYREEAIRFTRALDQPV